MQRTLLHVSPTYYAAQSVIGGGEKYILYLCRALSRAAEERGERIVNSLLSFGEQPGSYPIQDCLTCEVISGRPWDAASISAAELKERLEPVDVVLVHQCLSAVGLLAASHSRLLQKTVIGLDSGGGEHPKVYRSAEIGEIFDLFLAQSEFAASSYLSLHGRVAVIPGPVDTDYFTPDAAVPRDPELVVAIGRILPHKGFDRVIRSLPGNLRLVIAGTAYNAPYLDHLRTLANGARVEIREHLSDGEIRHLLRSARVFVHAATHVDYQGTYYAKPELLGLSPLEALSAGTPTLVSSAGALAELSTVDGCFVFEGDRQLASMLANLDELLREAPSSEQIHSSVSAKYGLEVFGRRFLSELGRLTR